MKDDLIVEISIASLRLNSQVEKHIVTESGVGYRFVYGTTSK